MNPLLNVAMTIFLVLLLAGQTSEPVSVELEPHHRVLLKNNDVLVLRATLSPGERTLYHTHSYDGVAVELARATVVQQKWNEPEGAATEVKPGDIPVRILKDGPYTHRIHNVGKDIFDVFDVEYLRRPEHPSASAAGPLAAETPEARVYKWTLAPGAASPMHTHERPYVIVAATAFQLKMSAPDGQSMSHEIKPGDFHWVTSKVTHSLANAGTTEGQIVEIEMK